MQSPLFDPRSEVGQRRTPNPAAQTVTTTQQGDFHRTPNPAQDESAAHRNPQLETTDRRAHQTQAVTTMVHSMGSSRGKNSSTATPVLSPNAQPQTNLTEVRQALLAANPFVASSPVNAPQVTTISTPTAPQERALGTAEGKSKPNGGSGNISLSERIDVDDRNMNRHQQTQQALSLANAPEPTGAIPPPQAPPSSPYDQPKPRATCDPLQLPKAQSPLQPQPQTPHTAYPPTHPQQQGAPSGHPQQRAPPQQSPGPQPSPHQPQNPYHPQQQQQPLPQNPYQPQPQHQQQPKQQNPYQQQQQYPYQTYQPPAQQQQQYVQYAQTPQGMVMVQQVPQQPQYMMQPAPAQWQYSAGGQPVQYVMAQQPQQQQPAYYVQQPTAYQQPQVYQQQQQPQQQQMPGYYYLPSTGVAQPTYVPVQQQRPAPAHQPQPQPMNQAVYQQPTLQQQQQQRPIQPQSQQLQPTQQQQQQPTQQQQQHQQPQQQHMYMVTMPDGTTAVVPADKPKPSIGSSVSTPTSPQSHTAAQQHQQPAQPRQVLPPPTYGAPPALQKQAEAPPRDTSPLGGASNTSYPPTKAMAGSTTSEVAQTPAPTKALPQVAPPPKRTNSLAYLDSHLYSVLSPTIESVRNRVLSAARDQTGCRCLQHIMADAPFECDEVQSLIAEIRPMSELISLMSEPYGNFFFQKLFEGATAEYRREMIKAVTNDLPKISTTTHGTFSVQKLIETLRTEEEKAIVIHGLSSDITLLMIDVNGGHVVQKLLSMFTDPEDRDFLLRSACRGKNLVNIANDKQGCCMIQKCMDVATPEQLHTMTRDVFRCFRHLIVDPFGNYVIQYFLDLYGNVVEAARFLANGKSGEEAAATTHSFSVHSTPVKESTPHPDSRSPSQPDTTAITTSGDREKTFSVIVNSTRYQKQRESPAFLAISNTDAAEFFNTAAHHCQTQIVELCKNKFGSNVVEKLLHVCCEKLGGGQRPLSKDKRPALNLGGSTSDAMYNSSGSAIVFPIRGCSILANAITDTEDTLRGIVSSNYGNYVVQTALRKVNLEELEVLLRQLIHLTPELSGLPFSKKLEVKVDFAIRRMGAEGKPIVASELFKLRIEANGGHTRGRGGSVDASEKSTTPLHGGGSTQPNSGSNSPIHQEAKAATNSPLISPQKANLFANGVGISTPTARRRAAPPESPPQVPPPPSYHAKAPPSKTAPVQQQQQPPTYGSATVSPYHRPSSTNSAIISPQMQQHGVFASGVATPITGLQRPSARGNTPDAFGIIGGSRLSPSPGAHPPAEMNLFSQPVEPWEGEIDSKGNARSNNSTVWSLPPPSYTNVPSLDPSHADKPSPTPKDKTNKLKRNVEKGGAITPRTIATSPSTTAYSEVGDLKIHNERQRKNVEGVVFLAGGVNAPAYAKYEVPPTSAFSQVDGPIVSMTSRQFSKEVRTAAASGKPTATTGLWGLTDNRGKSIWDNSSAPSSGKPNNGLADSNLFEDSVGSPTQLFSSSAFVPQPRENIGAHVDDESNSEQPLAGRSFADLLFSSGSDVEAHTLGGGGAGTNSSAVQSKYVAPAKQTPVKQGPGPAVQGKYYGKPNATLTDFFNRTGNHHQDPNTTEANVLELLMKAKGNKNGSVWD